MSVTYMYYNELKRCKRSVFFNNSDDEVKIMQYLQRFPRVRLKVFRCMDGVYWSVIYKISRSRLPVIRAEAISTESVEETFNEIARLL